MSTTIKTYVSSSTYDTLLNIMYPDMEAKDRTLQEVERLIIQGHTVEYRFGNNMSTTLTMEKFNEFIRPKYANVIQPINIQQIDIQNQLDNLTPSVDSAPLLNTTTTPQPEAIKLADVVLPPLTTLTPETTPEVVDEVKEETPVEEKVEEVVVEEKAKTEEKVEVTATTPIPKTKKN